MVRRQDRQRALAVVCHGEYHSSSVRTKVVEAATVDEFFTLNVPFKSLRDRIARNPHIEEEGMWGDNL